jgi:ankyrin repeat protein
MDNRDEFVLASTAGEAEKVQAILNQPRDLWESQLEDSLSRAICRRDPEIVRLLLSSGAKLNISSFSHLSRMADIRLLEIFLAHGWDINSTEFGNPFIRQVLMSVLSHILTNLAVYFIRLSGSKPHMTSWLLDHGADPNATNERGVSTLDTIAVMPFAHGGGVIDILLSRGARIPPDILTKCIRPTARGGPEVLRYFLTKGASAKHIIDHETSSTGTPLHYAAFLGKEQEVRLLLDAGADASLVTYDDKGNGYTPASLAKRSGHLQIYEMLVAESGVSAETE